MSYLAAVDQLKAMTPELYTGSGQPRRKFSLDEIRVLLAALGDPQRRFRAVLIAGTNGKGSTAATLASILTSSGLRVGLYTSPHLERVNERIVLNKKEIDDDLFASLYFLVQDKAQQLVLDGRLPQMPSFFETLTALAFLYFADMRAEIAVLEVGMGGRLDATNIVDPLLSVITDISLDHTEWLGSTLTAITREKAGILRGRGTLIALPQNSETDAVLDEVATALAVRRLSAIPYLPSQEDGIVAPYCVSALGGTIRVDSPLIGAHQHRNVALAIAAAVELSIRHGFPITPQGIAEGVRKTNWPARLERLRRNGVEWILDVAHNPAGAHALRSSLNRSFDERRPRILIFSCLRDKPLAEMAQILFPLFDWVVLTPIHTSRGANLDDLLAAARAIGTPAQTAESVSQALHMASERLRQAGAEAALIVVSGSVYLVGEARTMLLASGGVEP